MRRLKNSIKKSNWERKQLFFISFFLFSGLRISLTLVIFTLWESQKWWWRKRRTCFYKFSIYLFLFLFFFLLIWRSRWWRRRAWRRRAWRRSFNNWKYLSFWDKIHSCLNKLEHLYYNYLRDKYWHCLNVFFVAPLLWRQCHILKCSWRRRRRRIGLKMWKRMSSTLFHFLNLCLLLHFWCKILKASLCFLWRRWSRRGSDCRWNNIGNFILCNLVFNLLWHHIWADKI